MPYARMSSTRKSNALAFTTASLENVYVDRERRYMLLHSYMLGIVVLAAREAQVVHLRVRITANFILQQCSYIVCEKSEPVSFPHTY